MSVSISPVVRFGFLGAGWIAREWLAPAVHAAQGAVLQAVASRAVARAQALEPSGRRTDDYAALLEDPDVDVVYINLNNDLHAPWTIAALDAGKHVLCEKPLGLNADEVQRMIDAARAADRLLVEAFWYRWHPRTRRLQQLLAGGALGPLHDVAAEFSFDGRDDPRMEGNYRLEPRHGGGALYDVGCYAASLIHLALGADLEVANAHWQVGPTGVDLDTSALLRATSGFQAGARAELRCGIWGRDREAVEVTGEAARLTFTTGAAFTNRHEPSALAITTPDRAVRVEEFAPVDPYRLMVEAVSARVRGHQAFLVSHDHSMQVARTLDAIRTAAGRADESRW